MMIYGPCYFCKRPVNDVTDVPCFPVHGWEALRDGGGANKIMWRERDKTTVAHDVCVDSAARKDRMGISEEQGTLI